MTKVRSEGFCPALLRRARTFRCIPTHRYLPTYLHDEVIKVMPDLQNQFDPLIRTFKLSYSYGTGLPFLSLKRLKPKLDIVKKTLKSSALH